MRYLLVLFAILCLCACADTQSKTPIFHADDNPNTLSEWNVLNIKNESLQLSDRVTAYDLNSPLFSDYAHKLRTVWLPEGLTASYEDVDVFNFPVGTILSKTFYYPRALSDSENQNHVMKREDETPSRLKNGFSLKDVRLIETRLLVRRNQGWVALPYVWNEAQTEAYLKRIGDVIPLRLVDNASPDQDFNYVVPNANQCAGCHATNATTRDIHPIGPKARHLNKDFDYDSGRKNQLDVWQARGILDNLPKASPKNVDWKNIQAPLDERARSYLDINCSHCHNPVGPADTSGLHLETHSPEGPHLGICKLPIAAGTGTGDRKYDIIPGSPEDSIFTFRLESTDPAVMMPELGRSLSHKEGVALIADWIKAMPGDCG